MVLSRAHFSYWLFWGIKCNIVYKLFLTFPRLKQWAMTWDMIRIPSKLYCIFQHSCLFHVVTSKAEEMISSCVLRGASSLEPKELHDLLHHTKHCPKWYLFFEFHKLYRIWKQRHFPIRSSLLRYIRWGVPYEVLYIHQLKIA